MTEEDSKLLLGDLCARLPYHTIINYRGANVDLSLYIRSVILENCKPYLRPMSSMTEDELAEFTQFPQHLREPSCKMHVFNYNELDWLNTHHFDYRGLIEKGLAFEAPEGMYKTE